MNRHRLKNLLAIGALALLSPVYPSARLKAQELPPGDLPKRIHKTMINADPLRGFSQAAGASSNGIFYHGGPVLLGTPNVYIIWYGTWAPSSQAILTNLVINLAGSPYEHINTTYYDGSNRFVSGNVALAGQFVDPYSKGKSLSDTDIQTIVTKAIAPSGTLPLDPYGLYYVLTATDVTATSGFCSQYCGWHTNGLISGQDIKFAFVGNPAVLCPSSCAAQTVSPNGDFGADAMASVMSHEMEEAISDPDSNAWYDNSGNENADKCAWTFGSVYTAPNGSAANMNLGGRNYLIQQNWVNAGGGYCALSYNTTAPVLSSIAPSRGAPGTAVNVTLTGSGFAAGATVAVSGAGVAVGNVVFQSATRITATFTIAAAAAAGARSVTVKSGGATTGAVSFTVGSSAPVLTSVAPNTAAPNSAVSVTLTGSGFLAGATVSLSGSGIAVSNVSVVSPTQITATLTVGAAAVTQNISVVTTNGASNTVPFTIASSSGPPVLTSVTPNTGMPGTSVNIVLAGSSFTAGATLSIGGSSVSLSNVRVVSATQITATVDIAAGAVADLHYIFVSTAAGRSGAARFTITPPTVLPVLSSISPVAGKPGVLVSVVLTGFHLDGHLTVNVSGSGIAVYGVNVISSTQVTANLSIAASATPGAYQVSVTNAAGSSNTLTFTVN